jgi:hypothetical protein
LRLLYKEDEEGLILLQDTIKKIYNAMAMTIAIAIAIKKIEENTFSISLLSIACCLC